MEQEDTPKLDLGSLGSFDFTPDWAKKDAGVTVGKVRPARGETGRGKFGDRKSDGDKKKFGEGKPSGGGRPFGGKRAFGERGKSRFAERPAPLDAEVKVLPETKALGTIIRKLQNDCHAYKLKDLAYFFLDNPESVLLKITPRAKAPQESQNSQPSQSRFCQCKACGFASANEDDVVEHALAAHLGDYYDAKEVEVAPPGGNFNCVAKCGLSGVLLGPPNIHEFNDSVREMIRTRYPNMTEEQYRSHIEMVRDAESIEEWRKSATKKTMFVPKGQSEAEGVVAISRDQAEVEFRRNVLPSLLDRPKNLMITADVAMKSPLKPLVWAAKDALEAERRAPYGMCFALRGAFHHRKLHFFRANDARGPEFVTSAELKEFDGAHAIPELAAVAKFIEEHPCCDKTELPEGEGTMQHLQWLVSTGHVVAFAKMGVYSAVEKFPKYGPQWKKRGKKDKKDGGDGALAPAAEESAPAPAPAAEESAPEVPAKLETTANLEEEAKNETPAQLA